jgi:hypothetical protein
MAPRFYTMQLLAPRRVTLAFIIAPLATVAALSLCLALWLIGAGGAARSTLAGAGHASFFLAFFGLPIAYAVELCVGLPLYLFWRDRLATRGPVVAVTTLIGALMMPIVWRFIWGGSLEWTMLLIGAAMGVAAGSTFVLIAFAKDGARPAI